MFSFPSFDPVCCSVSSSNCCFSVYIQASQETGKKVRWSGIPLSRNFPHFVVIHTVKGFSIVNEAEVDVFLEFSCFFHDPTNVGSLIFGSSACSSASLLSLMLLIPSSILLISVCLFFSSYSSLVNISFIPSTVFPRSRIIFTEVK